MASHVGLTRAREGGCLSAEERRRQAAEQEKARRGAEGKVQEEVVSSIGFVRLRSELAL